MNTLERLSIAVKEADKLRKLYYLMIDRIALTRVNRKYAYTRLQ